MSRLALFESLTSVKLILMILEGCADVDLAPRLRSDHDSEVKLMYTR